MNNETTFWNKIAQKYAAKPVPDQSIYEKKLRITQKYLQPDMTVLEVGCGTGTTALIYASHVKHIRATDFASEMIEIAEKKARNEGIQNITFSCQGVLEAIQPKNEYDVIMAHSLIHLVDEPFTLIQQIYEQLKPGGYFITSTVCLDGMMRALKLVLPIMILLKKAPKIQFFSSNDLIHAHRSAGFEIEYQWELSKRNIFLIVRKPA